MSQNLIQTREELISAVSCPGEIKYLFFWGHRIPRNGGIGKSCLSQWYPSTFISDTNRYLTAEHYMMSSKARLFGDMKINQLILDADDPNQAKKLGRKIKNFDDEIWSKSRFDVVVKGNHAKFSQNAKLAKFLLATGDQVLVEASPLDPIWGIGVSSDHPDASTPEAWPGLNLLGFALMKVRAQLAQTI